MKHKTSKFCTSLFLSMNVLIATNSVALSQASNPSIIEVGKYNDWNAYRANTSEGWNCYVYSEPVSSEASRDNVRRDPVYLFVANLPDLGLVEDVSVVFGYPLKPGVAPTIEIGDKVFELRGDGEDAIISNPEDNAPLVKAMKRGSTLILKGVSTRGTETTDTFSLSGITAGLRAVSDCG